MNTRNIPLLLGAITLLCAGVGEAAAETNAPLREAPRVIKPGDHGVGRLMADLEFTPVTGNKFRLSTLKTAPAVVIAFTSTTCPVTKRYAPTLAAMEKQYATRGVKFIFVNPRDTAG